MWASQIFNCITSIRFTHMHHLHSMLMTASKLVITNEKWNSYRYDDMQCKQSNMILFLWDDGNHYVDDPLHCSCFNMMVSLSISRSRSTNFSCFVHCIRHCKFAVPYVFSFRSSSLLFSFIPFCPWFVWHFIQCVHWHHHTFCWHISIFSTMCALVFVVGRFQLSLLWITWSVCAMAIRKCVIRLRMHKMCWT